MSHLTEGQLHAYLDGSVEALGGATLFEARSHLTACDDCGARLDAARRVRDEAATLLDAAAPSSFARPPFQELERRAAREAEDALADSARVPSTWRPGSLAWAASLTVALTAGWLARGMVGPGMADRSALEAPTETIARQAEREVGAADSPVDRDAAAALERLNESADEVRSGTAGDEKASTDDRPAAVAEGKAEENQARRLEMAGRTAAKVARPDAAGPAPAGGAAQAPAEWQPVAPERAEAILGGALKTVEGLPVLSVYARAAVGAPEVWTAQQLASGHTLNLWQTPLGEDRFGDLEENEVSNAEADEPPAADPAFEMRTRPQQQAYYETLESLRVDGFLIEARAPLSPDSLRVLLSRLRD